MGFVRDVEDLRVGRIGHGHTIESVWRVPPIVPRAISATCADVTSCISVGMLTVSKGFGWSGWTRVGRTRNCAVDS
jgi:hypothetical protein